MSEIRVTPAIKELVVVEEAGTGKPFLVEISVPGPQGPVGVPGSLGDMNGVNVDGAVDGSLLYYDGQSSSFRADHIVTTDTVTDGGNF